MTTQVPGKMLATLIPTPLGVWGQLWCRLRGRHLHVTLVVNGRAIGHICEHCLALDTNCFGAEKE